MVDISLSGAWLITIDPSGYETSICIYSFSPPQRRNSYQVDPLLETTTLPNPDQAEPDPGTPYIRFDIFNSFLYEYFQHIFVENPFTTQFSCI